MCTVTWIQSGDRYSLFCNRDELRARQPSRPPAVHPGGATRFLAPKDGDAGGTWIAVNELGLSLCLLNDYSATARLAERDFTSRGHLVTELIQAGDLDQLAAAWSAIDPSRYRPFKLLALAPAADAHLLGWNGEVPSHTTSLVTAPLCSSSFDEAGATRARSDLYPELATRDPTDLRRSHLRFHQSHRPQRGPYSVCMHRPDAVTVSFTVVEVDPDEVSMAYAHGAPCSEALEHLVTLDRVSRD